MGIAYIAYIDDSGSIKEITGVPTNIPGDGAVVNSLLVKHIMNDELEALGFNNPAQFLEENHWLDGWVGRGAKPSPWYRYADGWVVNRVAIIEDLRFTRDQLLYQSDWTQIPDSPITEETKIAWKTYRQLLRDFSNNIPATLTDPNDYSWPTPPS